jgi:hypothetical protein
MTDRQYSVLILVAAILIGLAIALCIAGQAQAVTYYVTKSGSDTNAGTSWATAWSSVEHVNATITRGDMVRFGSGTWYASQIRPPTGGDASHVTVYACSTYSTATKGLTTITAGDSVDAGWSVYSGNVYRATWDRPSHISYTVAADNMCHTALQDGEMLFPQSSIANVSGAGQFHYDGTYFYIWRLGGGSPSSDEILAAGGPTVSFSNAAQDYVTFFGLNIHMGLQGVVEFTANPCDHNTFWHCDLAFTGYWDNPAIIWSGNTTPNNGQYNRFISCSIHDAYHMDTPDHTQNGTLDGSGAIIFGEDHMYFDSCTFYNIAGDGIHQKNTVAQCSYNVVRYSTFIGGISSRNIFPTGNQYFFNNTGVDLGERIYADSVYGCTFYDMGGSAIQLGEVGSSPGFQINQGRNFIANNTFYNCSKFIFTSGIVPADTQFVKYNIGQELNFDGYGSDGYHWFTFGSTWGGNPDPEGIADMTVVDSNMWYANGQSNFTAVLDENTVTFSQWQSGGYDIHGIGTSTSPGFTDPGNSDFSRSSSSQEINLTYGGRTWNRWGAWQSGDADTDPPTISAIGEHPGIDTCGINWTTNENANGVIYYRLHGGSSWSSTGNSGSYSTGHYFQLTGLTANMTYDYYLYSCDASDNCTTSSTGTFNTLSGGTPHVFTGHGILWKKKQPIEYH